MIMIPMKMVLMIMKADLRFVLLMSTCNLAAFANQWGHLKQLFLSKDNSPTEEDSGHTNDDDSDGEQGAVPRILYDNSAESDQGSDVESVMEPEEVRRAWEELVIIQREQQR